MPVTVVTAASGNYETTLMSEIEKSDPPTLFQVNGPVGLANWKDYCYDLKDADITKHLTSDSFALKEGDTVYGVAYVIETYGLIANTKLLEKAGYKASDITNFETLKKVADDIQARKDELGVDGAFTSAGASSGTGSACTGSRSCLGISRGFRAGMTMVGSSSGKSGTSGSFAFPAGSGASGASGAGCRGLPGSFTVSALSSAMSNVSSNSSSYKSQTLLSLVSLQGIFQPCRGGGRPCAQRSCTLLSSSGHVRSCGAPAGSCAWFRQVTIE